jgi:hypothetical protein
MSLCTNWRQLAPKKRQIILEVTRIADWRNGFIEADVISLDDPE